MVCVSCCRWLSSIRLLGFCADIGVMFVMVKQGKLDLNAYKAWLNGEKT